MTITTIHPRAIAIINGKGGVLKTTLTANQAAMMAYNGLKVLAIDLDPQGNLEDDLGYADNPNNDHGRELAKGLMFGESIQPLREVRPGLDVLTGGPSLSHAAASLATEFGKNNINAKTALARLLEPVLDEYQFIVMDCPPGEGPLQQLALSAARWVQIPTKADRSSIKGLRKVAERFDEVLDVNDELDLLGVVVTDVGAPANLKDGSVVLKHDEKTARQDIADELKADESIVYSASVRHVPRVALDARKFGLVAFELEDRGKAESKERIAALKRGEKVSGTATPKTAGSLADDFFAITQETINRVAAAETSNAPIAQEATA